MTAIKKVNRWTGWCTRKWGNSIEPHYLWFDPDYKYAYIKYILPSHVPAIRLPLTLKYLLDNDKIEPLYQDIKTNSYSYRVSYGLYRIRQLRSRASNRISLIAGSFTETDIPAAYLKKEDMGTSCHFFPEEIAGGDPVEGLKTLLIENQIPLDIDPANLFKNPLSNMEQVLTLAAKNSYQHKKKVFQKTLDLMKVIAPMTEEFRRWELSHTSKNLDPIDLKKENPELWRTLRERLFTLYLVWPLLQDSSRIFSDKVLPEFKPLKDTEKDFGVNSLNDFSPEPLELYHIALQVIRFSAESLETTFTSPDDLLQIRNFRLALGEAAASNPGSVLFKDKIKKAKQDIHPLLVRLEKFAKGRELVTVIRQSLDWLVL